jgi:hypothetical protein
VITGTVQTSFMPGLYQGSSVPQPTNASALLTLLDNNGDVHFALDPITGYSTIIATTTGSQTTASITVLARDSISAGARIQYSNVTGVITATNQVGNYNITGDVISNGVNHGIQFVTNSKNWTLNPDGTTKFPGYVFPSNHGLGGQSLYDDGNGNLYWNTVTNYSTATTDVFAGDTVTTVFTLTNKPIAQPFVTVYISGVTQTPGASWTLQNGNQIVFSTAPPASNVPGYPNNIVVTYFSIVTSALIPGPQGIQGVQGANGSQGITGAQGTQGAGVQGSQGTTGSGTQGVQGANGVQGNQGAGTQGAQGVQGPGVGAQGPQGTVGTQGLQGTQGTIGAGTQGAIGPQGVGGASGAGIGYYGIRGTIGLPGQDFPPYNYPPYPTVQTSAINILYSSTSTSTNQSVGTIAIGSHAGELNQGRVSVALGTEAGHDTQGQWAVGVGGFSGANLQGDYTVAVGYAAGQDHQKQSAVAIGSFAGASYQGYNSVAVGQFAGYQNQGDGAIAIGEVAGQIGQNPYSIAIGYSAGQGQVYPDGTGLSTSSIAIGAQSGYKVGFNSIEIGSYSTWTSTSTLANNTILLNATGQGIKATNSGLYIAPIRNSSSTYAVYYNPSTSEITYSYGSGAPGAPGAGIGYYGTSEQINIFTNTTTTAISQGSGTISIGKQAGYDNQHSLAVAIGYLAGYQNQQTFATAIGQNAGYQTQGQYAIAIGQSAGNDHQGEHSIAMGWNAASYPNSGPNGIALGQYAGWCQNTGSIAIGYQAGINGFQLGPYKISSGTNVIAIGYNAGQVQYSNAIAIGATSGGGNGQSPQGANSIAIGNLAGSAPALNFGQAANSIILNATGVALTTATTSSFIVKPIRQVVNGSLPTGFYNMAYNPTTGEIIYWT